MLKFFKLAAMDPNFEFEQTVCHCHQAFAYKVPPSININDFKCADWPSEAVIFQGDLKVITKGEACFVALCNPDTGAEASRFNIEFKGAIPVIEKASDSSRYFILIVRDPTGTRMAYIGLGFAEREAAFDFKVALTDHGKYLDRKHNPVAPQQAVAQDFSLKQGEKIKVNLKGGLAKTTPKASSNAPIGNFAPPPFK